jgi:hypothetical protein
MRIPVPIICMMVIYSEFFMSILAKYAPMFAWKNSIVAKPPIRYKADLRPLLRLNLTTVRFKKLGLILPDAAIIKPKNKHAKNTISDF